MAKLNAPTAPTAPTAPASANAGPKKNPIAASVAAIPAPAAPGSDLFAGPAGGAAAAPAAAPSPAHAASRSEPQEPLPPATPDMNPRNRVLAEIAARSNAERDAEAAETIIVGTDEDGEPMAPAPAAEPEETQDTASDADPAAPVAAQSAPSPTFDENAEYELIVHGKPMKFKGSAIRAAGEASLRKETAADQKLQEASALLARAEAAVRGAPTATADAQPPAAPAQPAEPDFLAIAQDIQLGGSEQAAAAMRKLWEAGRASNVVTRDEFQRTLQTVPAVIQAQNAFREAAQFATTEYADLLADPYLKDAFVQAEQRLRKEGDQRPPRELYVEIGEDMRKRFNRPKPANGMAPVASAAPAAAGQMAAREARKAAAPAAPRLASVRMEATPEAKPKTRAEIIEDMRRARGQLQGQRI